MKARETIEEVKKSEKTQRQLQDESAKVRGKEVDSKREIRDVAPHKFREEVMNDLVRNK